MSALAVSVYEVGDEYQAPVQTRRGDPSVAAIRSAMAGLKQGDAFEFRDRNDKPIRVERLRLAHYGWHFRVYHNNIVTVLPFENSNQRRNAALWVMEYLREHALWPTLKRLPGKALTFWHEYRGEESSSKQYVLWGEES